MLFDSDDALCRPNETIQTNFYRHVRLTSRDNNKLFGVVARALRWASRLKFTVYVGRVHFVIFQQQKKRVLVLSHKNDSQPKDLNPQFVISAETDDDKPLLERERERDLQTKLTESATVERARRRKNPDYVTGDENAHCSAWCLGVYCQFVYSGFILRP